MIETEKIMSILQDLQRGVLYLQADGGYKLREGIKLSDIELKDTVGGVKYLLELNCLKLMAAEEVLKNWGRMEEYRFVVRDFQGRVQAFRDAEKAKAETKKAPKVPVPV